MAPADGLLDLVHCLYAAVNHVSRWPDFLIRYNAAIRGEGAALFHHSTTNGRANVAVFHELDPSWMLSYETHYAALNVWINGIRHRPGLFGHGVVGVGEQVIDDGDLRKTEFYNDYLAPQDQFYTMGGTIRRDSVGLTIVTAMRSHEAGGYGADEIQILEMLMPHLDNALTLHSKLTGLETRLNTANDLLNQFPYALVVLDAKAELCFMNQAAEHLFATRDGIEWTRHGLIIADPDASAEVRSLMAAALRTATGVGLAPAGRVEIPRPSSRRPFELMVLPLPAGTSSILEEATAGIVIFLSDPEAQPLPSASILRKTFGLTHAESRLALSLARGKSIDEAAAELGITRGTARTQLKSVFSKTGMRRQGELIGLLLNSLTRFVRV